MRLFAKASTAGSIKGSSGERRCAGRRPFAARRVSKGADGSGAPPVGRPGTAMVASLVVLAALAFCASSASAATPTATVGSVSEIKGSSAHVTGTVNPGGKTGYFEFEYSTDQVNWSGFRFEGEFEQGSEPLPVAFNLHGLEGSTKYYVRLTFFDFNEYFYSATPNLEFETLPVAPPVVLALDNASEVAYTTAKVTGEVERPEPANPDPAFDAKCSFAYISDAQFNANIGNSQPGFEGAASVECNHPVTVAEGPAVEATLAGLAAGTTYHLRLVATNAGGTDAKEATDTFATAPVAPPVVTLDPITDSGSAAHFSGTVDPGAANPDPAFRVSWYYECEPSCLSLSHPGDVFDDDGAVHPAVTDAEIEPNTPYTIKLVASNAGGTVVAQRTLNSLALAPRVETLPAFALGGGTEALIGGKVNPRNSPTTYWVQYGPGPGGPGASYPDSVPADHEASAGAAGQFVPAIQRIGGLSPGTTYHFRIVAQNAIDTSYGEDVSFETPAPPPPLQTDCSNEKLRSETNSEQLPECRAYEMTTEPEKGGGDATSMLTSSPDGDRLAYYSIVGFADAPSNSAVNSYLTQRGPDGWVNRSMQPKIESPNLTLTGGFHFADFADDLSESISVTRSGGAEPAALNIFLTKTDGSTVWVTSPSVPAAPVSDKAYAGRSADGSHIVFESSQSFEAGVQPGTTQVWEWVDGQVRLVSELPDGGVPSDGAGVGDGSSGVLSTGTGFPGTVAQPTAVSADGKRIFFGHGGNGVTTGVYVREDGIRTRELSRSRRSGSTFGESAQSTKFQGAATNGSVAVFSSPDQLTNDSTPGGGLYSYDLETDQLRFLSTGAIDPAGAQVEGETFVSADGSHVYFIARSILVPGKGLAGGHNLYVSDEDGVRYIATLGDDDSSDWSGSGASLTRQATPDGRNFVFQSYGQLTGFDNGGHEEVYLYRADQGSLTCVSCNPEGILPTGDASILSNPVPKNGGLVSPQIGRPRVITEDGGQILFQTSDSLVPADVNGVRDVYLYHDGEVNLVSAGTSRYNSEVGDIGPRGRDIYFTTRDSLVGQDIDGGATDIYDARVDGGFPAPPVANPCETAATCQRTPSSEPPFSSPATTAPARGNPVHRKNQGSKCKKGKVHGKHGKCRPKKHGKHRAKKHSGQRAGNHEKNTSRNRRGN